MRYDALSRFSTSSRLHEGFLLKTRRFRSVGQFAFRSAYDSALAAGAAGCARR
jgi:hypothetical protein